MSNWQSKAIANAASEVKEAMRGNLRSDFTLAKVLKKLKSVLDDGEFIRFLMDEESGLSVAQATAYKFDRMVSAYDVVQTEKVWERIGWDGVSKVVKIQARNERVNVCRAIVRETKPIGKQLLADIMADKAPSYSAKQGRRRPERGMTKTRAIRELDVLKTTMSRLLASYPVLRREINEEVQTILGLGEEQSPLAG